MVGSFLNVVVYRLPLMLNHAWTNECSEFLEIPVADADKPQPFNLWTPSSRCTHCQTPIKPYQNIPVLSYLLLRGQCAQCKSKISSRYPIIEIIACLISIVIVYQFGYSTKTFFALILGWSLLALAIIDIDHQLLPDTITLPVLWIGLFISLFGLFNDSDSSIIGAIAGYLSLWSVYQLFKLATGKEGMGYGDFKLLAMLGAWLGWQMLPVIVFLSSLVGAATGISMILFFKHDSQNPIPFGPYLAGAGLLALLWGEDITHFYLNYLGLS